MRSMYLSAIEENKLRTSHRLSAERWMKNGRSGGRDDMVNVSSPERIHRDGAGESTVHGRVSTSGCICGGIPDPVPWNTMMRTVH